MIPSNGQATDYQNDTRRGGAAASAVFKPLVQGTMAMRRRAAGPSRTSPFPVGSSKPGDRRYSEPNRGLMTTKMLVTSSL